MSDRRRTAMAKCEVCGGAFAVRPSRATQRSCSNTCAGALRSGASSSNYNGGLCLHKTMRRWVICCRDGTLILYSRGVMAAEIGRLLTPEEIVHHVNENTTDDRPENLEITTRAAHMNMHRPALLEGKRRKGLIA